MKKRITICWVWARMEVISDRVIWEPSLRCDLKEEKASQKELGEESSKKGKSQELGEQP